MESSMDHKKTSGAAGCELPLPTQFSLVSAMSPTSFVLSVPNPQNDEPASRSSQRSDRPLRNLARDPSTKDLVATMKRLMESSALDEAVHPPARDSPFRRHDDGCPSSSSSSHTGTPYRQGSSPPLSAPAPSRAWDHHLRPHQSSSVHTVDRMPRVEAPLSVGSLKREYDLDTLRMHERRVRHALAQGRPLQAPPPLLPARPPASTSHGAMTLMFPCLVETRDFFGHIIIEDDDDDRGLDHCGSRAASSSNFASPSAAHPGSSQRTIVSASDESEMASDDRGWESEDDDCDGHDDDGIFELDLE